MKVTKELHFSITLSIYYGIAVEFRDALNNFVLVGGRVEGLMIVGRRGEG